MITFKTDAQRVPRVLVPRPYQEKAIAACIDFALDHHDGGSILISCPPGGGKTVIAAFVLRILAADQGLRGLAWAHRREIVFQIYDHLIACGVPRDLLGVIVSGDAGHEEDDESRPARRVDPAALIQVGTIQMITRRRPPADVVWSDEAHLDAAEGRKRLRRAYPTAVHIGTTGSPCRLDGRGLRFEYDSLLQVSSPAELIALGYLAEPRVWTVPPELLPDLRRVRKTCGDYAPGELSDAANRRPIIGGIVEHWKRHADGLRTFAFAVTIAHSRHITKAFKEANVPWEHVDGGTPLATRRQILDRVTTGDLMGVSCAELLTAGVDRPPIKCVIQARPTLSLVLHLQQTGRCMRPWNGATPVILDHAGNNVQHGLPQDERDWEAVFEGSNARQGPSGARPRPRACGACYVVITPELTACPSCGMNVPPTPLLAPLAPERDGALVELKFPAENRADHWLIIQHVAKDIGASPAWAADVYKRRYGVLPP